MRTGYNDLVLKAYSGTTPVSNAELDRAEGVSFSTVYPGGLFGDCSFNVPRDVARAWGVKPNQRIVIRNGLQTVYEGYVTSPALSVDQTRQTQPVTCLGAWGNLLMPRKWRKPWADTRIDEGVWRWDTASNAAEKCTVDRQNRIRFTPKAVAWSTSQAAGVKYFPPTGETIKRVTCSYTMAEGAQAWTLALYNDTAGGSVWTVTASGSGSRDDTLATPATQITLFFQANANQTPASDGTIYGEVTSLIVYTETGSINLTEIAKDCAGKITELSADFSLIASNSLSLVPFISEVDSIADILIRAASYGGSSNEAWAVGVRESDLATDGKPVMFAEAQPALTDYDYEISLDSPNLVAPFAAEPDASNIRNWIAVQYQSVQGYNVWVTPDDDATLKDTTSITSYGQREEWLSLDTTDLTLAKSYAKRFLAARKDLQWTVSNGITVVGYINAKGGAPVPASQIRAGKRVRVKNFLNDLSGAGLTFLITQTTYNDSGETCQMSVGVPNTFDVWLARTLRDLENVRK